MPAINIICATGVEELNCDNRQNKITGTGS